MATQNVICISPEAQHLSVQTSNITQLELAAVLSLRNRARQLEEQIVDAERSIRARLEAGVEVEAGERSASLKESFRRNVSWREVATRLGDRLFGNGKGGGYCERVGKFDIEGVEGAKAVEFKAIITFGKIHAVSSD